MQKYFALELFTEEQEETGLSDKKVYLASEVDAEIARLNEALQGIAAGTHKQGGWLTGAEMIELARQALKL